MSDQLQAMYDAEHDTRLVRTSDGTVYAQSTGEVIYDPNGKCSSWGLSDE